jgi:hypothetical protein
VAYRFNGSGDRVNFAIAPLSGYASGPITMALFLHRRSTGNYHYMLRVGADRILLYTSPDQPTIWRGGGSGVAPALTNTSLWYLFVGTIDASNVHRVHVHDGTAWTHTTDGSTSPTTILSGDTLTVGASDTGASPFDGDVVVAAIKKGDSTDAQVEALSRTDFSSWMGFGFDWLVGFETSATLVDRIGGTGGEIARVGTTVVADAPGWSWSLVPVVPVTNFSYAAASLGSNTINFADATTGTPTSWDWDFGDGSTHGTVKNPTHAYAGPGTYTVTLNASNAIGTNAFSRSVTVGLPTFVQRGPTAPAAGHAAVVVPAHVVKAAVYPEHVGAATGPMAAWSFTRMTRQAPTWQVLKVVQPTLRPAAWLPYVLPTSRGIPGALRGGVQPWYWYLVQGAGDPSTGPQAGGISVY